MDVDLRRAHVRADHDLVFRPPRAAQFRLAEIGERLIEPDHGARIVEHVAMAVV